MKTDRPLIAKIAAALLALLSIGPLVTGLDLIVHFLPTEFPAVRNLHSAHPIGQALWIGAGFLGITSAFLLSRRPVLAVITCTLFAVAYVPGAVSVWLQFTVGCWLAITSVVVSAISARAVLRANNSFKPKPLRGSA